MMMMIKGHECEKGTLWTEYDRKGKRERKGMVKRTEVYYIYIFKDGIKKTHRTLFEKG
jgi:hypothetical protein